MTVNEFRATLAGREPPANLGCALQAMWYDAKKDWHQAHTCAQAQEDDIGSWVHAYLHRVEGDAANAAYWYRRAGRPVSTQSFADEWHTIVTVLLAGE
jgi:hypothetical protein